MHWMVFAFLTAAGYGFFNFFMKLSGLIVAKVLFGLFAVCANLFCILKVIKRRTLMASGAEHGPLAALHRKIIMSAVVGLPFAAAAASIGLYIAANLPTPAR